jgi:hypothetical protein
LRSKGGEILPSALRNLFKRFLPESQQPIQQGLMMSQGLTQDFGPMYNEELAKFVNDEYTRRQSDRRPFEIQWRLNAEFLNGNQYLDINPVTMTIEEIPKLTWYQEREVFNQIASIVETRIAKQSRQKPILKTRPASSDDVDISAAKVESMLLGSAWNDQDMDDAYEDYVSWLELTGTVLWKTTWNTRKGRLIYRGLQPSMTPPDESVKLENEAPSDPQADQALGAGQQMIEIREGDLDTIVVPSYEFFPDSPWRSGLKACRSVIHARAYHLTEIEDIWGVQVDPEEVDVMSLQRTTSGLGGMGYGYGSFKTSITRLPDHAVVKEYYEKPCRKYPQGRFIVVAGNKCLYAGPMPYQIGTDGEVEFPFVRTVSLDRPGCFWGKTVLERCIPVQRRYNALRNRKQEYLNMVAVGQWYAPIGSLDDGDELNNAPGNIIWYRPGMNGARPEPVSWPSLPASFENEEQTLLAEFTAISGVSELSRFSEAPSGVKSGRALGIASEQDDTRISTSVRRVANSSVSLGKMWIRLYRQFVQEPRMLRWIGPNREVDVREWEMSDLRSDDVFIENAAALAETPSERRQMVFDLLNAGLFNRPELSNMDEEGRQKVFQLLEFGHWETGAEDDNFLQKSRARRENRDMMTGQPIPVMDFDDHMLHILQHNRMRMQAEYEELMKTPMGPVVNQLMMAHIAQHIQLHLQSMQHQQSAAGGGQQSGPAESISFKDLPPQGQVQMAAQAGIKLNEADLKQQQAQQQQAQQQKMASLQQQKQQNPNAQPAK